MEKENELSIVITSAPDKKRARNIGILFTLWLIGGAMMIAGFFDVEEQKTKVMLLVWMGFWLYFSYVMVKALMWQLAGREIIKVRDGKLLYKRDVQGRGWVHDYDLGAIRNLRARPDESGSWIKRFGGDYWSTDCDSLAFDYKDREIAFGYRLNEKESEKIRKLINAAQKAAAR